MTSAIDVYEPDEIESLHQTYGWMNYLASAAHARRMQAAQDIRDAKAYAAHVKALEGKK